MPIRPRASSRDAQRLIDEIARARRTALLVGGTMLYFKALFDGIDEMPAADPAIRAELEQRASHEGWPALHAELATVDPVAAARIAPARRAADPARARSASRHRRADLAAPDARAAPPSMRR